MDGLATTTCLLQNVVRPRTTEGLCTQSAKERGALRQGVRAGAGCNQGASASAVVAFGVDPRGVREPLGMLGCSSNR